MMPKTNTMVMGMTQPSAMTMSLRHQVSIKNRFLSILHLRLMIHTSKDTTVLKTKFFN